jgi:hypothetical protein
MLDEYEIYKFWEDLSKSNKKRIINYCNDNKLNFKLFQRHILNFSINHNFSIEEIFLDHIERIKKKAISYDF